MPWQQLLGFAAGLLTMLAAVPQISKAWKTREVGDISLIMLAVLVSGLGLWTVYGIVNRDWPVIVTNGVSCLLNAFLLGLVLHERKR